MERRLFLAIFLSILVFTIYSRIVSRFYTTPAQQEFVQEDPLSQSPPEVLKTDFPSHQQELVLADLVSPKESFKILEDEDIYLNVDLYGSEIKECKLKSYDKTLSQTNMGLLAEWQDTIFSAQDVTDGISTSYNDIEKGFEIRKNYRLTKDKYIVEMDLEFITHSNEKRYAKYSLNIGSMKDEEIKKNTMDQRYIEFSISLSNKILRSNFLQFNPKAVNDKILWAGIRDRYFCVIVRPLQPVESIIKSQNAGFTSYFMQAPAVELIPGQKIKHTFLIYLGPQKQELIRYLGENAEYIVNFGVLDSLSQILLDLLKILHKTCRNWGVTIILFSLLVFIITSPLSIKSFRSMKKMQELQPIIEELKIKYKDSPQKMHKEVMELYREKKINPLGGCLPLFLQMPIFIALYQTLMRFIDLKGARFLWIKDLSEPDRLFVFSKNLPIVGSEFNLLPIIMIITMLVQQKLTSGKGKQLDSTAQQQKMMSLFLAIFFGIIFYHMPAGLVLYWTVNSILMLIFQMKMFISKV